MDNDLLLSELLLRDAFETLSVTFQIGFSFEVLSGAAEQRPAER